MNYLITLQHTLHEAERSRRVQSFFNKPSGCGCGGSRVPWSTPRCPNTLEEVWTHEEDGARPSWKQYKKWIINDFKDDGNHHKNDEERESKENDSIKPPRPYNDWAMVRLEEFSKT